MRHDCLGNPISARAEATAAGIDDFILGFLGYETRIAGIIAAADADPDDALANAYAGYIWMFLEAPGAPARAAANIARARLAAPSATPREAAHVDLVEAWAAGDAPRAQAIAEAIAAQWPLDLVAVKLGQYFAFNRGVFPDMLRLALGVAEANRDVAHLHGMLAFAYEQCHLLNEAEASARRALDLKTKEPWAQHALAHVMLTQGRVREGIAFLDAARGTWVDLTSFMHTHNWWHLAVFLISEGDFDRALAIYDSDVWGIDPTYSQDQIGAVSLLARLELAGVDVGDRWDDLAPHLAARAGDVVQPFLSLHYLHGLGRLGLAEADQLLAAMRDKGLAAQGFDRAVWAEVAVPAAEGILAATRGDPETAQARLGMILPRLFEIGGSHAQRDLFDQIRLDALMKSGRLTHAQQVLEQRRAFEPEGVPLNRALGLVYERLGLSAQAAAARARARR